MRCATRRGGWLLLVLLPFLAAEPAEAHEVRPAYLELKPGDAPDTWEVLFRVPAKGEDLRLSLAVEFPPDAAVSRPPVRTRVGEAFVDRWAVRVPGGLEGATIRIAGLRETMTDVLVRVALPGRGTQVARLTPGADSFVVAAAPRAAEVARTYLALGVEHILGGADHLLFVLALFLLVRGAGRLVATVTAFTAAHSVTLGAATLGFVRVPGPPVEAVIALSVVFVAREIAARSAEAPSLTERRPWLVALLFGLLHGLGFASALREAGLPEGAIPLALLLFNLGVEAGQLLLLAVAALVAAAAARLPRPSALSGAVPEVAAAYGIGGIASLWFLERAVAAVR